MGMSASQVRLLTITKRIHEVENEAERIQNQKMLLGLQSDEAYEEYLHAMETKNIEYSWFNPNSGNFEWEEMNLNRLFNNANFHLKVRTDLADGQHVTYNKTTTVTSDPVAVGFTSSTVQRTLTNPQVIDNQDGTYTYTLDIGGQQTDVGKGSSSTFPTQLPININGVTYMGTLNGNQVEYDETTVNFTYPTGHPESFIYSLGQSNYSYTVGNSSYNFDYQNGTVTTTTTTTVPVTSAKAAQDGWIECESPIEVATALGTDLQHLDPTDPIVLRDIIYNAYGIVMAEIFDEDTQQLEWKETSVATNTGLREMTDKDQLAIAEANYEAALRKIDKKEEHYDKDLAKMDQERKALTTQLETLKTCIKENIDRTFKIFQG